MPEVEASLLTQQRTAEAEEMEGRYGDQVALCYLCAARCPQGVPVTEMIYTLKGMAIKRGIPPRGAAVPAFINAFARTVERNGRNRELPMIARFYLGTDPREGLKHRAMGLKLFRQGRLPIFGERDSGGKAVRAMLRGTRRKEKGA